MITCPKCNSSRIGRFRLDSDWGNGGDWSAANVDSAWRPAAEAEYTRLDLESFDGNERPDVECCVCCVCAACFDA